MLDEICSSAETTLRNLGRQFFGDKFMKARILLLVVPLLLLGCQAPVPPAPSAPPPPVPRMQNAFNESDLQPYLTKGSAFIIGQAFLKTRGGDLKFGAGCKVSLFTATPYFEEWFDGEVVNETLFHKQDVDSLLQVVQKYKCGQNCVADGSGNFSFRYLPAGRYLLYCKIGSK
jgi:uncharacterized protein YodC (DUF2158 family)